MAKIELSICDRCKRRSDYVPVRAWTARRGSQRLAGDLCDDCMRDLVDEFKPVTPPNSRHQVIVREPTKVPRKRK